MRHALAWVCLVSAAGVVFSAGWWWQKLAAIPLTSIVAAVWITAAREADRHRSLMARLEAIAVELYWRREVPAGLIPYVDPVRGSNRTGQLVYQFVRSGNSKGQFHMTTTLEQLIASFLQIGLAKIDTKLSPTTQQMIDAAVPTLVATIAGVVVDLADNHKATKASGK